MPTLRYRVIEDTDPDLSWLDDNHADPIYPTHKDAKAKTNAYDPRWYQNPENHVTLAMICERKCAQCGSWKHIDSLYGIDFLITKFPRTGTYTTIKEIPDPYLRSIARDQRAEAIAQEQLRDFSYCGGECWARCTGRA